MAHSTVRPVDTPFASAAALPEKARSQRARLGLGIVAAVVGLLIYVVLLGGAWWATLHYLPDRLTVRVLGHALTAKELHRRILSNAMLIFAILPFAFWLECASAGWERSSMKQILSGATPSIKTDLAVFILGQAHILDVLGRFMMLGASMISGLWIHDYLSAAFGFAVNPAALPLPLQVIAYFFVYSFFDYWSHRIDHSRYFWPLHRYHHSAEEFCVLTAGRQHPAAFSSVFFINLPLAVLGAPPAVMIYVNVLVITLGFLIHSNIDSNWGWIGRYVIQSPLHHRLHHQLDYVTVATGHYALTPVWDHLFGTWRGEADQSLVIGVDTPYRHGFWVAPDLVRDYRDFWFGFRGLVQRRHTGG